MKERCRCVAHASDRHECIPLVYILFRDIFLCKRFMSAKIQTKLTSKVSSSNSYLVNKPLTKRLYRRVVVNVADSFVFLEVFRFAILRKSFYVTLCHRFVSCPKQGLEIEAVVLHRVEFLDYFCPQQDQDFKPSTVPISPNKGKVPPPGRKITQGGDKHCEAMHFIHNVYHRLVCYFPYEASMAEEPESL